MVQNPLVTIITPCFNGETFVERFFQSIFSQTYSPLELIFVDDGSMDNTSVIAEKYKEHFKKNNIKFLYLFQENSGQAKAMNTAFQYMNGKYLVWPDSDDILTSDSIKKRVEFMEKNPDYNMIRSNGLFYDYESGKILNRISNSENRFHEDIFMDLIMETTYCACGCYMIRVSEFKNIYPDLHIYESKAGQNWQILIPMAGRNKCAYLDEDQYLIAIRQGSHSRKKRSIDEQVERYLELKNILLHGIELSGRDDKNYVEIVEHKYERMLMNLYLQNHHKADASIYYKKLKFAGELTDGDQRIYLSQCNNIKYQLYRIISFAKRRLCRV